MRKVTYPQEIEVWYVLPAIRKQIALALIKKGMSQKEIAKIMNVTEASISHYKKSKRATEDILETPKIKEQITLAIDRIVNDNSALTSEVLHLNKFVKDSGLLCKIYAKNTLLCESDRPCSKCEPNSKDPKKKIICFSEN
jgi:predicted transcriptional regulator